MMNMNIEIVYFTVFIQYTIHSVSNLLGRPVHQLVDANIESASHVAASKCIKACRHRQEVQLLFRPNIRMWQECDQSDFDHGMIVGSRQGDLNISEMADLLGFSYTTVSRVCREFKKQNNIQ